MIKYSTGGYRIIDLQAEDIFAQMSEIITEEKPLLISRNEEYDTKDFITSAHDIQLSYDSRGNVIEYRVPTGGVCHSDIDSRGEEDYYQYFTFVRPSGNEFKKVKVSELFNREAQTIHVSFPSELTQSVKATSNFVDLWVDTDTNKYFIGQFSFISNKFEKELTILDFEQSSNIGDIVINANIVYNEETLEYDITVKYHYLTYHKNVGFEIPRGSLDVFINNRRLSDTFNYDETLEIYSTETKRIVNANGQVYMMMREVQQPEEIAYIKEIGDFIYKKLLFNGHTYEYTTIYDGTKYLFRISTCSDAEPLYADTTYYGDVKINDHNIDVADGVISVKSASTENRGVVQIDNHNIDIADESIISVASATTDKRGVVQIDDTNITVTDESIIGVNTATKEVRGVVQVGDNIDVADGVVSVPMITFPSASVVSTKGVASVDRTIEVNSGILSVTVNSMLRYMQPVRTPAKVLFNEYIYGEDYYDGNVLLKCIGRVKALTEDLTDLCSSWYPSIDDNTFIGDKTSDSAIKVNSAFESQDVLLPFSEMFLTHKVNISENTYYIRVPIYFRILTSIMFLSKKTYYMINGYINFNHNSLNTWDSTDFIPDLEVGSTGTKVMTYETSTSQVTPMMKAFSVNITMPDGNTCRVPSHELYVQDGKAYIVTADIYLNQENPAVTDTFATYTFTRVF